MCIAKLEEVLSKVGLHGRSVKFTKDGIKFTKDAKTSGQTQDRPRKICIGAQRQGIFYLSIEVLKAIQSLRCQKKHVTAPPIEEIR